jgi:hypothetical protein
MTDWDEIVRISAMPWMVEGNIIQTAPRNQSRQL